jgi:integrase
MSRGRPRGLVTKRGSRWTVILSNTDPATGERRRHYHAGYLTRREAEKARTALLSQMDGSSYVPPEHHLTVARFLSEKWLPEVRERVRPSTYESYRLHVDSYLVPRIGGLKIQTLKPDHLNRAYRELRKQGGRNGRSLSDRTVELTHVTIRRALKDAQRWGYVDHNAADAANRPRPRERHEIQAWTAQELGDFLAYVRVNGEQRLYPLWLFIATTGVRRGEALGLRWQDVNLDNARISIRQTLLAVRHIPQFGQPKTKKGKRNISLDAFTVKVLRSHRKAQAAERLAAGSAYEDQDLVFATEVGGVVHPDRITRRFGRLVQKSGLPRVTLHGLRHSYATIALEAGIHPKVVSERLGHSTVSLTLDVYSHIIPALHEEAAERVAALINASNDFG